MGYNFLEEESKQLKKPHDIKSRQMRPLNPIKEKQQFYLQRNNMKRIELNQESEEVERTYKVISILKTLGHNIIIFRWLFFFSAITK